MWYLRVNKIIDAKFGMIKENFKFCNIIITFKIVINIEEKIDISFYYMFCNIEFFKSNFFKIRWIKCIFYLKKLLWCFSI